MLFSGAWIDGLSAFNIVRTPISGQVPAPKHTLASLDITLRNFQSCWPEVSKDADLSPENSSRLVGYSPRPNEPGPIFGPL